MKPSGQALRGMKIVETDVETRTRLRRDHVGGRVSHVYRGQLEIGLLKMLGTLIKPLAGNRIKHSNQARQRIVGEMRIGGHDPAHRSRSADLSCCRAGRS